MTKKSQTYRGVTLRLRGTSWQVDFGTANGARKQRSYGSKQDAKRAIDDHVELHRLAQIKDRNHRVAVHDLTDKQRIDVMSALDELDGRGTLVDAVRFYVEHSSPVAGQRTVTEVFEEYLEGKRKANRRKQTLVDVKMRIGRLATDLGDRPVHQITTHDLERWLGGMRRLQRTIGGWSPGE